MENVPPSTPRELTWLLCQQQYQRLNEQLTEHVQQLVQRHGSFSLPRLFAVHPNDALERDSDHYDLLVLKKISWDGAEVCLHDVLGAEIYFFELLLETKLAIFKEIERSLVYDHYLRKTAVQLPAARHVAKEREPAFVPEK